MAPNPLADLGAGLSTKSVDGNPLPKQHGPIGQTERAFTAASTFLSGLMAISATQFLGAPLKMIDPKFYEAYMAFTKQSFGVLITTMAQWWAPTVVRVSGDKTIPKQLFHKPDGSLECRFPKRLVMMANHQLYTDWLYLWWVAYTNNMHGYIYIILKESLKNIPIIGWGAQFYNFIFLKRKWEQDKASFQQHLNQLNNPTDPMWLLIFPEGTNLAKGTREKSAEWAAKQGLKDMKHQLLPRSKGLQFCLQNLRDTTEWLYDCTIGYEGIPPGQFGQDIFTLRSSMFEGRPPKSVNMHFRRFKIADIPVDNDKAFDVWLRNRWREKDYLLEHFAQYNRFPEDDKWLMKQAQVVKAGGRKGPMSAKSIETQIKSNSLEEFLSIFAPLSSIMTVLFLFYGGGKPEDMLKMIGDAAQQQQKVALVRDDTSEAEPLKLKAAPSASTTAAGTETSLTDAKKASGNMTPAQAQQNMIQQYVKAIRPYVEQQVALPDKALRASNAGKGEFSPRSNQKPGPLVQKLPPAKKAATTVGGDKAKSSPQKQMPTTARAKSAAPAAPVVKTVPQKANAAVDKPKPIAKRPQKTRTFSSTSTVHPHDSISAVGAPTSTGNPPTTTTKPASTAKPVTAKKPQAATPIAGANNKAIPKTPATAPKNVSIDPAMLMRMKSGGGTVKKEPAAQKKVQVDPGVLSKMRAGNNVKKAS